MLFRYIGDKKDPGDDKDPPKKVIAFGHEFVLGGDAVEVVDPMVVKKLTGNRCFAKVSQPKRSTTKASKNG